MCELVEACTRKDPAQRPDIRDAYHILKEAANAPSLPEAEQHSERAKILSAPCSTAGG